MKNFLFLLLLLLCNCSNEEQGLLMLSSENLLFEQSESIKKIIVEADSPWYLNSTLPVWLSISQLNGENGHTSVSVAVSDNDTDKMRFSTITFSTSQKEIHLKIAQKTKGRLRFVGEHTQKLKSTETKLSVEIDYTVDYELIIPQEVEHWIRQEKRSAKTGIIENKIIDLIIAENHETKERYAELVIRNQTLNLSDTLCITQVAGSEKDTYLDGDYKLLQKTTKGNGVNLIVMGDGFTKDDLVPKGRYEDTMLRAINYFFSIEPYRSYRDYFNIYMVIAESEEEGVSTANDWRGKINNKFETAFGQGTAIECNDKLCFEYARKIKELKADAPITVIMPLNSTKYAGTAYLYSDGNSIALCPMSDELPPNDFEGIIHHEAGGHAFGFLCDEYVYYKEKIPEKRKTDLKEWQKRGFQCNLDFTDNLSSILWKSFIGVDKYSQVGAYEGGYEYQYGVWRSEENSCMNNNIPYYNVQSRWIIVSRIMQSTSIPFTIDDFISADHTTVWNGSTRGYTSPVKLPPLGSPRWIK